jgi:hypothetical protein
MNAIFLSAPIALLAISFVVGLPIYALVNGEASEGA